MARTFNPQFAQLLSEAFSRAQIRPLQVTQEHLDEAISSANFVLTEFTNLGVTQFQLVEQEIELEAGEATYELMEGALDAWHVMYRRDGMTDTPVWPIARSDYHSLPDKDTPGLSNQYFTERGKVGNERRTITLWPVPDRDTDTLSVWVWCRTDSQTNDISTTAPIAVEFIDAYADAIGLRMAKKFNRDAVAGLAKDAARSFDIAFSAARERTPARFRMRGYTRGRRF
jgi:hypothetical protein